MRSKDSDISATVRREQGRLRQFIRRRIDNAGEAEDILQDVFYEFVQAYRLPAPIEQASAWLYRVARNRIIDRFRKRKELPLASLAADDSSDEASAPYLDLLLPADEDDPEAIYARSVVMAELQAALEALPEAQREVFIAHELEGRSFRSLAEESGLPINTLLARKRYAVQNLRQRLQTLYQELDM